MRNGVWLLAVRGVAAIVFGLLAVAWPSATVVVLTTLFGVYALATGLLHLGAGLSRRQTPGLRGLFLLTGLTGVLIAGFTFFWPSITAFALAVLVGLWAVAIGVLDIWAAVRWRAARLLAVVGVVSVLAGLLILFRPDVGTVVIAQVIGVYAIVAGVVMVAAAWQRGRSPVSATRAAG
ncbi:HdeD family acid-resistance protein [Micromonospora sp. NPDC005806]|uniref:HdeD family acid-resistance protein n=1 Tax=Micromonospora sp. NPDC005806 TaxID=3364234 RepID=UPI0036BF8F7F